MATETWGASGGLMRPPLSSKANAVEQLLKAQGYFHPLTIMSGLPTAGLGAREDAKVSSDYGFGLTDWYARIN
jgi:hypothetical protein